MDENLFGFFLFAALILAVGLGSIGLSSLVGPRKRRRAKQIPYECGKDPIVRGRTPITVQFYLVAILFVLFDIETIFLIPWAIIYEDLEIFGLVEMGIFVGVLAFGLLYVWKKGVLDWGSSSS